MQLAGGSAETMAQTGFHEALVNVSQSGSSLTFWVNHAV
jgi:hypothetical protein